MKYLLLFVIKIYWKIYPIHKRRKCIFKVSCSCHIYNLTEQAGFLTGVNALWKRFKQCRAGYTFYIGPDGQEWVILKDLTMVIRNETNL